MVKNIFFALLTLVALGTSPALLAADQPGENAEYVPALPADTESRMQVIPVAEPIKASRAITKMPTAQTATAEDTNAPHAVMKMPAPLAEAKLPTTSATESMPPASADTQAAPAADTQAATQPSRNTRPIHDNHTDYRYCLKLKTNREIAECRYKK
jgi:hypothetical protein